MPVQFQFRGGPFPGRAGFPVNPLLGCLPLFAVLMLMCLVPVMFFDFARSALERLQLSPASAALAVFGIFLGSFFNIPVYHIRKDELQPEVSFGPAGMAFPRSYRRVQQQTVIAVNVGGCLIPLLLAAGQLMRLISAGNGALMTAAIVSAASIFVCWRAARPMEGIGILIPGFIPPLVSVLLTRLLLLDGPAEQRAATAFVAGVVGPLVGADLLNLGNVMRTPVAVMSIGGAGTFDGIVLSGILAAFLA
jgi:uncharacterized membrane protein